MKKILLSLILLLLFFPNHANRAQFFQQHSARQIQAEADDNTIFLPIILRNYPPPAPIFGLETHHLSSYLDEAEEANATWIRYYTFSWKDIEPVRKNPPKYIWDSVDEADLAAVAESGMTLIPVIKYAPDWAVKYPGVYCGPIAQDAFDEFAQFLRALVQRYGGPPYNFKYWEIGNEIDVEVQPPQWSMGVLGCWGEVDDPYDGGGYYADMLKQAYPAIKAVDPQAKVLIGGLLLGCDPDHPLETDTCKSSKFLEGILKNGGGPYFDIVSFHSYAFYWSGAVHDTDFKNWIYKGGQIMGKINFLRQVMQTYNTDKPLMLTEISLLCVPEWTSECDPATEPYFQAQSDFVITTYMRTWAADVKSTIWYTLENQGWRYSSLIQNYEYPGLAYNAYKFMAAELEGAEMGNQITQYTGVTGYKFNSFGKQVWVLWSTDNIKHSITLPIHFTQAYDKFGDQITPVNGTILVKSPVYVELSP